MATIAEIDSFTSKFKALLANGFAATLTVEAIQGEAFITLKSGLGSQLWKPLAPSGSLDQVQTHIKRPRSPAYYRRQEKRKLARVKVLKAAEAMTEGTISEEVKTEEVKEGMDARNVYKNSINQAEYVLKESEAVKALDKHESFKDLNI